MPRRYIDYPDAFAGLETWCRPTGSYNLGVSAVVVFPLYGVFEAFSKKRIAGANPVGRGRDDARMAAAFAGRRSTQWEQLPKIQVSAPKKIRWRAAGQPAASLLRAMMKLRCRWSKKGT